MITTPQKQMLILATVLFCIVAIIVTQAYFLYQFQQKNRNLIHTMDLLEINMEKEQEKNRMHYDSLQSHILLQINLHNSLKEELSILEKAKAEINLKTDENKITILRIYDVDSLRDEVARHYRR